MKKQTIDIYTVEPRYNEAVCDESGITNDILYPSKIYGSEPRYKETWL